MPKHAKSKRRSRSKSRSRSRSKSKSKSKSKSRVRIYIRKPGAMKAVGYGMRNSAASRHAAIRKAIKKYGYASTMGKISVLYIYNKNKHPSLARIAKSDVNYLKAWKKKNCPSGVCGKRKRKAPLKRLPKKGYIKPKRGKPRVVYLNSKQRVYYYRDKSGVHVTRLKVHKGKIPKSLK